MAENENGKGGAKSDSPDDILDKLAEEYGVEEDEEAAGDDAAVDSEAPSEAAADEAAAEESSEEAASEEDAPDTSSDDEAAAAPAEEPAPKKGKAKGKGKGKAAVSADTKPAAAASASVSGDDEWDDTPEGAIRGIFVEGPVESRPGNPEQSPLFTEDVLDPPRNPTSPKFLIITLTLIIAAMGILYATLNQDQRQDMMALLQGRDIIAERMFAEQMRVEEERRVRMENAPRFGTVEILTIPQNFLVEDKGLDAERYPNPVMIFQGTRRDLTVPTRTRVVYENIPSDKPFEFTIHGEGVYQDQTIVIPPFRDSDSPWVQDFTGNYSASLTIRMEPLEEGHVARELTWRRGYRPDAARERDALTGTITITSEPEGAMIAYNNNLILDEEGRPARTPHTFSTHPAPPDAENQDPRSLFLSREGVRIDVRHPDDSKARVAFGVYLHQYRCELVEGAEVPADDVENPDFYGLCNYVYEVNVPILEKLPEPPPEEAEEGTAAEGAAAEGAAAESAEGAGEGEGEGADE